MKKGIYNNRFILICGALVICVLAVIAWKIVELTTTINTTSFKGETKHEYAVISNTPVSQIRATLDAYVRDPKSVSETLVEGLGDEKSGLKNFSNDYYKSKFVVINSKDSMAGGREFNIMFTDKPDKVFWVWVYKLADGNYEMRGFQENTTYTPEKIVELVKKLPFSSN